jgi:thymidylate synthase
MLRGDISDYILQHKLTDRSSTQLTIMKAYLELLKQVYENGKDRMDRTGVGTRSIFGAQARFSLEQHFPLLTTKRIHWKSVVYELLWFLQGNTNKNWLNEHGVRIWDEWAKEDGDLGRIYGAQWTDWRSPDGKSINQIENVVAGLKSKPYDRRHIVCAWNPGELDQMALPPCHTLFQFYVDPEGGLSCQLYQRSADLFLGVPFNIASYALLTVMIAQVCGLQPREFIHTFGDLHIYQNHFEQVETQLARTPDTLPTVKLNPSIKKVEDFTFEDIELSNYSPQSRIKAPVAV